MSRLLRSRAVLPYLSTGAWTRPLCYSTASPGVPPKSPLDAATPSPPWNLLKIGAFGGICCAIGATATYAYTLDEVNQKISALQTISNYLDASGSYTGKQVAALLKRLDKQVPEAAQLQGTVDAATKEKNKVTDERDLLKSERDQLATYLRLEREAYAKALINIETAYNAKLDRELAAQKAKFPYEVTAERDQVKAERDQLARYLTVEKEASARAAIGRDQVKAERDQLARYLTVEKEASARAARDLSNAKASYEAKLARELAAQKSRFINEVTSERDRVKAERDQLAADLRDVKEESTRALRNAKAAYEVKLARELAAQKASFGNNVTSERDRLEAERDQLAAELREVKYEAAGALKNAKAAYEAKLARELEAQRTASAYEVTAERDRLKVECNQLASDLREVKDASTRALTNAKAAYEVKLAREVAKLEAQFAEKHEKIRNESQAGRKRQASWEDPTDYQAHKKRGISDPQ